MTEQRIARIAPQAQPTSVRGAALPPGEVEQPGLMRPADGDALHVLEREVARVG